MTEPVGDSDGYTEMNDIDLTVEDAGIVASRVSTPPTDENDQCFVEPPPASPLANDNVQQMGIQQVEMAALNDQGNGNAATIKQQLGGKLSDDDASLTVSVDGLAKEDEEIDAKAANIARPKMAMFMFVLNAVKNIIGTSVLIIPWCFAQMGYVFLPVVMLGIAVFCTFSFVTLGRLRDKTGAKGYSDIFAYTFGWKVALLVDINNSISAMAIVCCYTIVIGSTLPIVLKTWAGTNTIFGQLSFTTQWAPGLWIIAICILFPLACKRDLHSIRHASMVGVGGILWIVFGAILMIALYSDYYDGCYVPPQAGPNIDSPLLIFAALPILGGICDAHMNAPRFAYEFKAIEKANEGKYSFKQATIATISIVILLSLIFGWVGIFHIGMTVQSNILDSYPKEGPKGMQIIASTMQLAGVMSVTISFVLFFNALRASVVKLIFREGSALARRFPDSTARNIVLTAILVFIPTLIGTFVGDLGGFQGTLWGISGSLIVYILPMLAALKLDIFETNLERYTAYATLGFGVIFSLLLGTPMAALSWANTLPKVECPAAV